MKSYSEIEQELDNLIKERKTKDLIIKRLLDSIKKEDLGMNQVTFHKEWYD